MSKCGIILLSAPCRIIMTCMVFSATEADKLNAPWVEQLLRLGKISELDRATLAQTVKEIRIFEDKRIEITYLFSDELKSLLEK